MEVGLATGGRDPFRPLKSADMTSVCGDVRIALLPRSVDVEFAIQPFIPVRNNGMRVLEPSMNGCRQ
jgi:hypothetical protein